MDETGARRSLSAQFDTADKATDVDKVPAPSNVHSAPATLPASSLEPPTKRYDMYI